MKSIAIIGGGMSGLIASHVARKLGFKPEIFEPGRIGAGFLSGGLKYLVKDESTLGLVRDYGIPYTNYAVKGGVLLAGKVRPHPGCFLEMEPEAARRVREDHWRKTRGVEPSKMSLRAMNDPEANGGKRAIRCDFEELVKSIAKSAIVYKERVRHVALVPGAGVEVKTEAARRLFHACVVTTPLWIARLFVRGLVVPECTARKLNIVEVEPLRDPYSRWDYVYTPYTPAELVHRISPNGSGYSVEFNGDFDGEGVDHRLMSDLNYLFHGVVVVTDIKKGLNGHLMPFEGEAEWPAFVRPLGRFAQWDSRATTERTIVEAERLLKLWTR